MIKLTKFNETEESRVVLDQVSEHTNSGFILCGGSPTQNLHTYGFATGT